MRKLLPEEELYLELSGRCEGCEHLAVLHNAHCCEFCMVPGCNCAESPLTPDGPAIKPIIEAVQRRRAEKATDQ